MTTDVAVLGLWHLGSVATAGWFALDRQVTCWDADPRLRDGIAAGRAPVTEPGLEDLLRRGLGVGQIRVANTAAEAISGADVVHLAYDSWVDQTGGVSDGRLDEAISAVASHARPGALLMVSSQVAAGTCSHWRDQLADAGDLSIACWPENLRLGQALEDFLRPTRLLVGWDDDDARKRAGRALKGIDTPMLGVGLTSAEMAKHATNAFLALCICFANELAWLTREAGGDPVDVTAALRADARVASAAPLRPGTAFSGATLRRDVVALSSLGRRHGRGELFDVLLQVNERHSRFVLALLQQELGSLAGRLIAVAGLTYKPGTSTLRDSLALRIVHDMIGQDARVRVYDPDAEPLPASPTGLERVASLTDAVAGADALAVLTALPELSSTSWSQLHPRNRLVADGCGGVDADRVRAEGWTYRGL